MIRKVSIIAASLVAMASVAFASQSSWNVTVKVSPATSATVTGGGIGKNTFALDSGSQQFTIAPNPGYYFTKVAVDGKAQTVPQGQFQYSFTPPKNHSLTASFALQTFQITTNGTNGKFSVATETVKYGATTAIKVTPNKGYLLFSVTDTSNSKSQAITVYSDKNGNGPVDLSNGTSQPVFVVLPSVTASHQLTASFGTSATPAPPATLNCSQCHPQAATNASEFASSVHDTKGLSCGTCHVSHSVAPTTVCITCHQALATASTTHALTITKVDGLCAKCHDPHALTTSVPSQHFNAYSSTANPNYTAAYVTATANTSAGATTCATCHRTSGDQDLIAVRRGWASSGHGDVTAVPWKGEPPSTSWLNQGSTGVNYKNSPQATNCIRCHTAAGFAAFVNSNFVKIDKIANTDGTISKYSPTLVCSGCHNSIDTGALRLANFTTSANGTRGYKAYWGYSTARGKNKVQIQFPYFQNSAICVPCHSGRSTAQVFTSLIAQAAVSVNGKYGNYSTIATSYYQHLAQPGQTFIGRGAYDFSGTNLVNYTSAASQMRHTTIQMSSSSQGPCVGCHYSGTTHSLAVNFTSSVCQECHGPAGPDLTKFTQFSSARSALDTLIRNKFNGLLTGGVTDLATERINVRFGRFNKAAGTAADAATATAAYGAWYNWQILETYDPNAWAHNPAYARAVLNETLAYLQTNGADLNGQAANVTAALAAAATLKSSIDTTGAAAYVAGNTNSKGLCVACHAIPRNAGAGYVQDNNGVRQITGAGGEFQQWSHHIINDINNSKDPVDEQCAVCHMEGVQTNGVLQVNKTYHLADSHIHLRDCNTSLNQSQSQGGQFIWDPANPNHTAMDQFCMSCHNAAGAVTAVAAIQVPASTNPGHPQSALNPFGDLIQNNYDGLFRNAVVPVYDQFDPNNTAHHAVRAPRYTANTAGTASTQATSYWTQNAGYAASVTKVAATGSAAAAFANISASNAAAGYLGLRQNNGTSFVGTLSDTGKFVTTYQPLVNNNGSFKRLADNAQLHCGDCHTVGQWAARGSDAFKAYSTAYGPGVSTFYKRSIGAHGSGNEYMLRNSAGDNNMNPQALVCYICHSQTLYDAGTLAPSNVAIAGGTRASIAAMNANGFTAGVNPLLTDAQIMAFYNMTGARKPSGGLYNTNIQKFGAADTHTTGHDNVPANTSGHCNALQNTTAGLTGLARLNATNQTALLFARYTTANGKGGNGNAFGIKCSNCHNSGDGTYPGYGGIHGNSFRKSDARQGNGDTSVVHDATYTSYSSIHTKGITGLVPTDITVVTGHKPYRFLPGLGNFRFNHGTDLTRVSRGNAGDPVSTVGTCYTLTAASPVTPVAPTYPKGYGARYGGETNDANHQDDNGLFGSWGACQDHSGPNTHGGTGAIRNVLRPARY